MKIGVFDSGIGGEAVAQKISASLPNAEIITVNDKKNVPYGLRTLNEITVLTDAAIQPLLAAQCDCIVIACNTATAAAIEFLRTKYPDTEFIGLEPMIKPATELTKSGVITVCATPATLASERYHNLKSRYGAAHIFIEPDCSDWARLIEHNAMNADTIIQTLSPAIEHGSDVVVLACTHYHWIKDEIITHLPAHVAVIDPSDAIVKRIKNLFNI